MSTESPIVSELAGACVQAVHNAIGVDLDFTQDTLPLLDHYASLATGPREEVLGLVAPMCGVYFGEVLRRHLGPARWHTPEDDYAAWRLEFEHCFLHFNPVGMAVEAVLGRDAGGWGTTLSILDRDRKAIEDAVELYGDVKEADFYRFSVRFEVIEQAVRTLEARSRERGETAAHFTADAYAAAVADEDAERGKSGPLH